MQRTLESELEAWRVSSKRKPLLIRGARQVGKSYLVERFGATKFQNMVTINFELNKDFKACFGSLAPDKIIQSIELLVQQRITPNKTLLFLDEIQQCPQAIMALRYFKEKMPDLHVIGAGSFLELVINADEYQQPVGRVESLYLYPCSFKEFLLASGREDLVEFLSSVDLAAGIPEPVHQLLLEQCRLYFILGGMPEAIAHYLENKDLLQIEKIHAAVLEYYRRDLAKYTEKINTRTLEILFNKAPGLIAKHFKYVDIDPDISARDQRPPLEALIKSGVIHRVLKTSASGLPLAVGVNPKKFKLLHLDLGLATHAIGLEPTLLMQEHLIHLQSGVLAEQFVGQELIAYSKSFEPSQLFYWERDKASSQAEVDYVMQLGSRILPVEVKSGKTGRLKSLNVFLDEKKLPLGIRISQSQLGFEQRILSIPLYMIDQLPRLVAECS